MPESKVLRGWFVYRHDRNHWHDPSWFTVEDDDGETLALSDLAQFHGKPVRIVIEEDDTLTPDTGTPPLVHQLAGMTPPLVRRRRDRERDALLALPPL